MSSRAVRSHLSCQVWCNTTNSSPKQTNITFSSIQYHSWVKLSHLYFAMSFASFRTKHSIPGWAQTTNLSQTPVMDEYINLTWPSRDCNYADDRRVGSGGYFCGNWTVTGSTDLSRPIDHTNARAMMSLALGLCWLPCKYPKPKPNRILPSPPVSLMVTGHVTDVWRWGWRLHTLTNQMIALSIVMVPWI